MINVQLTKNFSLDEFLISQTAERHGIDMTPNAQVIANLTRLCCQILQPLRNHFDTPVIISSGYRPAPVNRLIGGAAASQHVIGQAADIIIPGHTVARICEDPFMLNLPFDQRINEFGKWVHLSVPAANEKPRYQRLIARHVRGETTRYDLAASQQETG